MSWEDVTPDPSDIVDTWSDADWQEYLATSEPPLKTWRVTVSYRDHPTERIAVFVTTTSGDMDEVCTRGLMMAADHVTARSAANGPGVARVVELQLQPPYWD